MQRGSGKNIIVDKSREIVFSRYNTTGEHINSETMAARIKPTLIKTSQNPSMEKAGSNPTCNQEALSNWELTGGRNSFFFSTEWHCVHHTPQYRSMPRNSWTTQNWLYSLFLCMFTAFWSWFCFLLLREKWNMKLSIREGVSRGERGEQKEYDPNILFEKVF